jgi:uncharacterized protein (DUF2252 family)
LTLPTTITETETDQLREALMVLGRGPLEVLLDGSQVRSVSSAAAALLQAPAQLLHHPDARVRVLQPSAALSAALLVDSSTDGIPAG